MYGGQDVTVIIPTIPPRKRELQRALYSVLRQTVTPRSVVVMCDHDAQGPLVTRNAALEGVQTEWVAFLDDDDEMYPEHLEVLLSAASDMDTVRGPGSVDLLYPWFQGGGGVERVTRAVPFEGKLVSPYGVPFNDTLRTFLLEQENFIPVTVLVRTERLRKVGGFQPVKAGFHKIDREDMGAWQAMLVDGAQFVHVPKVTWRYNYHEQQTFGLAWTGTEAYQ